MLVLRSGTTERELMPFTVHEVVWKRSNYWAMVALPPDRIAATADEGRWLRAVAAMERTGEAANARLAYGSFLKRWPENVGAAIGLANSHYALGALPEAERVLRDAMKRAPDSVIVLNNLAQTLSDQGKNEEALPLIERAVEQTGSTGPYAKAVLETRDTIRRRLLESSRPAAGRTGSAARTCGTGQSSVAAMARSKIGFRDAQPAVSHDRLNKPAAARQRGCQQPQPLERRRNARAGQFLSAAGASDSRHWRAPAAGLPRFYRTHALPG